MEALDIKHFLIGSIILLVFVVLLLFSYQKKIWLLGGF